MSAVDGPAPTREEPGHASIGLHLRLAWRNLWRNPRRTALSLAAVAFAAVILVFMVAMQQGGYGTMIESAVSVFTGHLQVEVKGYDAKPRLREAIPNAARVETAVAATPGVVASASRAESFALVSSPSRTYGALVVGVEPGKERAISTLPGTVRKGRFLDAPDASEAVVGETLAHNLSLAVGDEITVLGQGYDGALAVAALRVVGIFSTGTPELDRQLVEMPLAVFQSAFSLGDRVHRIVVKVASLAAVAPTATAVGRVLPPADGLVVLRWDQLLAGLKQGIELDAAVGWFLYFVLVFVVTFGILNTFLMAVMERTRELGVLLALGTRPAFLARVVILESLILVLLGLALGTGLGAAVTGYASVHGISFSSSEELLARFSLPARIYPRLNLLALTAGPLAILVATSIAALFPLLRVRRLKAVEAMKAV